MRKENHVRRNSLPCVMFRKSFRHTKTGFKTASGIKAAFVWSGLLYLHRGSCACIRCRASGEVC